MIRIELVPNRNGETLKNKIEKHVQEEIILLLMPGMKIHF